MIQISYIAELTQTPPPAVTLVEDDAGYVSACAALRDSGAGQFWVRQKHHYTWLQRFLNLSGLEAAIAEKTPRHLLADAWQVAIPDWLTDEAIKQQGLLKIPLPDPIPVGDFSDRFLSTLISSELAVTALTVKNLAPVMQALCSPEAKAARSQFPLLNPCLDLKLNQWQAQASSGWIKSVVPALREDAQRFWQEVTIARLLRGYPPQFLEYAVPVHRATYLRNIPLPALIQLPLNDVGVLQASEQIELFFAEAAGTPLASAKTFSELLAITSGSLAKEFLGLDQLLAQAKFSPSQELITKFREKFKSCPGVSSAKLEQLNQYVVPTRPSVPAAGETWDAARWLQWTLNEYVPFRHWQTLHRKPDAAVEAVVQKFSDWYLQPSNYTAIHGSAESSLVHTLASWKPILSGSGLVVIAVVDNLSCTFWNLLVRALANQGLSAHAVDHRFAPLPSETATCKPMLVSGDWNASGSNYAGLLQQQSQNSWSNKPTHYYPNLKALSTASAGSTPAVHLLNFLPVDTTLHEEVESQGDTYEDVLFRLFTNLAAGLKSFLETWEGKPEDCNLLVVTDHGSTRILSGEQSTFDSSAVKKLFADEHHRFARMTQTEAEELPENLWALGYRFKSPFADADAVFFIPRGHNTVKAGGDSHGYAHGGATPEEVIVPVAAFKMVQAPWKEPLVRFIGLKLDAAGKASFYLSRTSPVQIEVRNLNPQPLRILRIEVEEPSTDLKEFDQPQIAANQATTLTASSYFNKAAATATHLRIVITYEIVGQERTVRLTTPAQFNSAVKSGGLDLTKL